MVESSPGLFSILSVPREKQRSTWAPSSQSWELWFDTAKGIQLVPFSLSSPIFFIPIASFPAFFFCVGGS